jgi:Ca-activated chloride channel family protein
MRYALMRCTVMLALLAIALPAEASSNWDRLWFNADQRGEKLLQHGDAGAAARIYKDPRRRAYAEMKAGDYRQAASELDKLHDSDSEYNRGNALAKLGDLKGALDAYDAALKRDPKNHDAQHNRDLVEKALKQQQPQQNNQQQNGQQNNKSGGKQGSNSGGQGSQSGKGANNDSGQQSAGKNSDSSGKSGGKPSGENSAGQQNAQSGANGKQAQQNPQNNSGQTGQGQPDQGQQGSNANATSGLGQSGATAANMKQAEKPGNPSANGQSADAAAQAKMDAAAGLAASKTGAAGNRVANAAPADQTAPLSEQQLSKEQWLRNIPDDPGGLLRRKFMIEYMLRQQKAQQ